MTPSRWDAGARRQPGQPAARSTTRCSRPSVLRRRRPDRRRLLDRRHRRQPRPDQLRHQQGRRDRLVRRYGARRWPSAASRSTRSRPGFIETRMTARDAAVHPRGRPADEQPGPGRPAGRRRRDDRLVRRARHRRRSPATSCGSAARACWGRDDARSSSCDAPPSLGRAVPAGGAVRAAGATRRRRCRTPSSSLRGRARRPRRTWPRTTGCAGSGSATRCRPTYPHVLAFPLAMQADDRPATSRSRWSARCTWPTGSRSAGR